MNVYTQLEDCEGRKKCVYADSLGFLTIGIGFLVDERKPGAGLWDEEIDFILRNRVAAIEKEITEALPWYPALNDARKAAVINMSFQLGVDGLMQFKNMLAALRDERWYEAETHALDSQWAKQTPARARRMAHQLATGEWQ